MALSENEMDRELLARVAEKYFADHGKTEPVSFEASPDDGPGKNESGPAGSPESDSERPKESEPVVRRRRLWRPGFGPISVL